MSNLSEYIKKSNEKDMQFFYGKDYKQVSNKYFTFKRVVDNDNIIIITENVKIIKDSAVLIVDNDKVVYLKDWQARNVHNFDEGINAYAVKLNRNFFKTYTFKKPFEEYSFLEADTFDSLYKMAQEQEKENLKFAEGHME